MKVALHTVAVTLLLLALNPVSSTVFAQGTAFTYQGRITDNGTNFNGTGQFKFALVTTNGTEATWWSNDGTSVNGSQPSSAVSVSVSQGLFTINLGNTNLANMTAIPATVFSTATNLQLMIWFNDGVNGFALLSPPQNLTPEPYAIFAEGANAAGLTGSVPNAALTSVPATSLNGPILNSQLANNSVRVNAGTGLSGGGTVALGASTTLNNAGVTALTGSDGVTVSASSGSVTLGLGSTLTLPTFPVSVVAGGNQVLFVDGNANIYAGLGAGNQTASGSDNTGSGYLALQKVTSGINNTANGVEALINNTDGGFNTAIGAFTLQANTDGTGNTANGSYALYYNKTGNYNTAIGYEALFYSGFSGAGGTNNIALGYNAGLAFTGNESSNIDIGNPGVVGESKIIRIGIPGIQTATYLSGTVYANGVALTSDRNAKEHFSSIDAQTVLAKVAAMPVTEWNYKDDKAAEHIGPMAQDFHAAFGLDGADDKHISVVDENGVALAAIQGLNQKLEAENAQLRKRLDELEAEVKALAQKKQ